MEEAVKIALESGFSHAGPLDCSTIELKEEVRKLCEVNTCQQYGTNWACPPACGSLEKCTEDIRQYKEGIIVQTTAELEDSLDFEGMQQLGIDHEENFKRATEALREKYPDMLILGTGGCNICKECTYPDNPCRFPDKKVSSMEAYGMIVNDVCKANNIPYYYGSNTLTYVGCFLLKKL
ncbi:Predicted metal-binding protein [Acetitomaculum ruminis DSM 5522]|uniref:Predicted metal-binding protein n=1 Tax=Acetitomaculum ruminis DSM 5522 TaxID=1120918 RepID=A0A1I0XPH1_9FIRM|nr:DUF2284 domain-containing protein [Acetitomaculum ruminis]SFB01863.1 Predicted metal-binding protein [Acetitomaculum ruminis DSM 5522]